MEPGCGAGRDDGPTRAAAFGATDANGGCIDAGAFVQTADGWIRLREARRGLVVSTAGGPAAVETVVRARARALCEVRASPDAAGVRLTPWHPVRVGGGWAFPADVARVVAADADVVSVLLEAGAVGDRAVLRVAAGPADGVIEAVALAHGIEGRAVGHPFYGTARVREALGRFPAADGVVTLEDAVVERDEAGRVSGLRPPARRAP